MRSIPQKQLVTLTLGMAAGVASAAIGGFVQNALHVDGSFVFLPRGDGLQRYAEN